MSANSEDDREALFVRVNAALDEFDKMEGRIVEAFLAMQKDSEAGRRHVSELWSHLQLRAMRQTLFELQVALEK